MEAIIYILLLITTAVVTGAAVASVKNTEHRKIVDRLVKKIETQSKTHEKNHVELSKSHEKLTRYALKLAKQCSQLAKDFRDRESDMTALTADDEIDIDMEEIADSAISEAVTETIHRDELSELIMRRDPHRKQ
jgi:DNA-binding transcriptional regulator WhiA